MKRSKILLVVIAIMLLSTLFACSRPHAYGEWSIEVEPTLYTTGVYVQVCEGCGKRNEEEIPALSDTSVWTVTTVPSTHTVKGKTTYTSTYGTIEVTLELVPHDFGEWFIDVAPTLDTAGVYAQTCSGCDVRNEQIIPALSDTSVWTVETVPSTHTVKGTSTYTSTYGTVVITLDLVPHVYGDYTLTVIPTLTEAGVATRTCECEDVEETVVPALSDTSVWAVTTVPSTHTVKGKSTYTSIYGTVEITHELVPHVYGAYTLTVIPTLTEAGVATRTCECEDVEETVVPALSDTSVWTLEHTALPTYDKDGKDTYTSVYGVVEVVIDSLVAPFEGKTYHSINFDAYVDDQWKNGVVSADKVWSSQSVTLDQYGYGIGSGGYPFRGAFKFVMVNALTGEIRVETYEQKTEEVFVQDPESWDPEEGTWETIYVVDDEGNPVYDWTAPVSTYTAWIDMETGLIIAPRNNDFSDVNLYTHYEAGYVEASAVASAWDGAMAIEYTFAGTTHSIFVYEDKAHFGVSFVDLSGLPISADQCYNTRNVHVLANDGSLIAGFTYDATEGKLVASDGAEGVFANGTDSLYLSGNGVAELNGNVGTYVINQSNIGVYVNGEYLEVTVDGTNYTAVKPMVTITFDGGEYATIAAIEVNKNIAVTLPAPETEQYTFKGWSVNGEVVEQNYVPTESVTLVAVWKAKVVITINGALEGDAAILYLGEGDVIGDYLPQYGIEVEAGKIFRGWYLDEGFEIELPEEAILSEEDVAVTIYAKWEDLPAYYGTYYGTELYNAGYGNYGGKTLTIDENGNMSGFKTGVIVDYDPETQVVSWQESGKTDIYKFYFNAELGVIAGIYRSNEIDNDFYFLSRKNPTNGKVNAYYGVKAPKTPGSSTRGWYAHFINAETDLGTREVFLYNNYIYTNFTAVDGMGNPVTAANVKNSKVVIVKDADGNVIVSVASKGTSFANNSNTVDLDAYFGTYTNGAETVILDGVGGIVYGDKTGTYALAATGDYFDVYFADPAEYYRLTLDGASFEIEKPMVTIVLDGGEYAEDQTLSLNVNVAYTLPVYEDENNVFNGWYQDAAFANAAGETIVPTQSTTLYALWKVKAVLTVVYNNGEENGEFIYSVGDEVTLETPIKSKMAFVGWFTTEDLVEGTEWANGTAIEENTTIYAKWEVAPAFYNTYTITRFTDTNTTGKGDIYCYRSYSTGPYTFAIDPSGNGVGSNSPFNGSFTVENYNKETGYLEIHFKSDVYYGYLDSETGIIITEYIKDRNLNQVFFFNPVTTAEVVSTQVSHSYWNNGFSRAIQYTFESTTYSIFVHENNVYYNVTFKNGANTEIAAFDCYTSDSVYVYDANGALIAKFAHDGTSLQAMDGFEGTYATADGEIVVNGVATITIGGVDGTYAKAEEGSAYTHDAYVAGVYYEVTLDNVAYTATVVKPMVTITYETDGKAEIEASVVNKNIAYVLPTPTNDAFIFRAWYFDAEFVKEVPADFIPTVTATLYAKWDAKVTLTVVYGNGLETVVLYYGVGDTVAPQEPVFTNDLVFDGWYLDADFTQAYTVGTIETSTTIYCAWKQAVAAYGSYYGFNLFGTGTKTNTYFSYTLTVDADGTTTGNKSGMFQDYDPATGFATISGTYFVYYNVELGILATPYGSKADSLGTDMNVFFKEKPASIDISANITSSGYTKLLKVTKTDGTSYVLLVMNDTIKLVTSWETTDGTSCTEKNVTNASGFTTTMSDGTVYTFVKSGSYFVLA